MESIDRQKVITRTAIIGIITNLVIAAVKVIIGLVVSSLAIISEGVNNASDSATSFLTLIGAKLSTKHPDEKHPFGYGRIEYLTALVIGIMILFTGVSMLRESIDAIIHPAKMAVTILAICIVGGTAIVKFILGVYTERKGRAVGSESLIAVGKDSKNDSFFSLVTIISSIIFLVSGISLDAYASVVFSFVVLKTAYETLKDTASDLIGTTGRDDLAKTLYNEIAATEGVISVADMMLHSYGSDSYSGSANVEIDHKKTIGEAYEVLHDLQLRIMNEHNVVMVFGIYAVDKDSPYMKELRSCISEFTKGQEHIKSFHALYLSPTTKTIYCDFIVDYDLRDWDGLREEFLEYMAGKYPDNPVQLVIETEFV